MDELSVVIEGIGNKAKKLIILNRRLKEKIQELEADKQKLEDSVSMHAKQVQQLQDEISIIRISGKMVSGNSSHARQKMNDLLREIEKCQALLNR